MKVTTTSHSGRVLDSKRISLSGDLPESERVRIIMHDYAVGTKLNVALHRIEFMVVGVRVVQYTCGSIERT